MSNPLSRFKHLFRATEETSLIPPSPARRSGTFARLLLLLAGLAVSQAVVGGLPAVEGSATTSPVVKTAIIHARLVDVGIGIVTSNAIVLIENDRIVAVGQGIARPPTPARSTCMDLRSCRR